MIALTLGDCVPKGPGGIITRAVKLLIERLGINDYNAKIQIHMHPSNNPKEGGFMTCLDELNPKPRDFLINITPGIGLNCLLSLSHEMVHVRQHLQGTLGAVDLDGKHVPCYYGVVADKIPYKERPWEREAHDLMMPLTEWVIEMIEKEERSKQHGTK